MVNDGQEHLARQFLHVFGRGHDRPGLSRMADHVDHQSQKALHKIFPGTRLTIQAAL